MLAWNRVTAALAAIALIFLMADAARAEGHDHGTCYTDARGTHCQSADGKSGSFQPAETWCGLPVVEEADVGCEAPYRSRDYRYNADRMELAVARRTGGLYAPYNDRLALSLHDTDLEHVVARSEAHASGGCLWEKGRRREFANDTLNAVLAFPRTNRVVKRAKDAGEWMPMRNRRWFAWRVHAVKTKWGLSVDRREADALAAALGGRCP